MMNDIEEKLRDLVQPLCRQASIMLIDLRVHGVGKNRLVKATVDTEKGITLEECQNLTREINDLFFRKDIFRGEYRLEVTSPGVQKPLEHAYEFQRSVGRTLQVLYQNGTDSQKSVGELLQYSENQLVLSGKSGQNITIPIDSIVEAKIKLKW